MGGNDAVGLLGHDGLDDVPPEELRLCVVLNGGVSLAVWMGGAVLEIDRLVKASETREDGSAYGMMLRLAGATARTDVIAGTSAGGINGAALALAQVNTRAQVASLRDLWIDQGQIETLLRQPFRGSPSSLMRGDEYFLPQLNRALVGLAKPRHVRPREAAPVDLTMATTVLRGNQLVTADALGQRLPQELHAARLHWRRWPMDDAGTPDPFADHLIEGTAAQMALAARASASFPAAFEPTFLPVREDLTTTPRTLEDQAVRPDLDGVVESWGNADSRTDRSRFVVDGGLLANTPTQYALEAIQAMPAAGPVRRVMMLVYPHAPAPGVDQPDRYADAPTLRDSMTQVLGALSSQGGRTFVEEVEAHNRAAAGRRGTRSEVLTTAAGQSSSTPDGEGATLGERIEALAGTLFPHYRRLRQWRAARDLAAQRLAVMATLVPEQQGALGTWTYERTRTAAESAQRWLDDPPGSPPSLDTDDGPPHPPSVETWQGLPYVPHDLPTVERPDDGAGWWWGNGGAERVAEAAGDVIRRLMWVLPRTTAGPGDAAPSYERVAAAYGKVSEAYVSMVKLRRVIDAPWDEGALSTLTPDESYWRFRLGCYSVLVPGVGGGPAGADLTALAGRIADAEGERLLVEGQDRTPSTTRHDEVLTALSARVSDVLRDRQQPGRRLRGYVEDVVEQVRSVLGDLRAVAAQEPGRQTIVDDWPLQAWADFLAPDPAGPPGADVLLARLLQLEVATTTIGDDIASGSTLPVELVQLSAQTQNAFMRYTRTADDKLAGMSVKHFGGFLKRSWRVNDWIWGRMDAATVLALTVLHPTRVRRAAMLSGFLRTGLTTAQAAELAAATVSDVVTGLYAGSPVREDPRFAMLREQATAELQHCFDLSIPPGDLATSMPGLAALMAWAVHLDVLPEDVGALSRAIRADERDGANARSHGSSFVAQNGPLLATFAQAGPTPTAAPTGATGGVEGHKVDLLAEFDRAGIGREPFEGEVSSDLVLRAAMTTAAVTATTLDSANAGLGAARLVTRTLRGAMLVVYWTMTGLTSTGVLARSLSLLGFALGGVLVVLTAFGALPSAVAAPAALVGVSLLLLAFAYGALRSGTMLHGLVLLTPVVPLLADAYARRAEVGRSSGLVTVVAVLLLAVALMLLGTLKAAGSSPYADLGALATRHGYPPPATPRAGVAAHLVEGSVRRVRGLAAAVRHRLWRILLVVGGTVFVVWLVGTGWHRIYTTLQDHRGPTIAVAVVLGLAGIGLAAFTGFSLQALAESRSVTSVSWRFPNVVHPVGVQAGWSALYALVYLGVGVFLVIDPYGWSRLMWAQTLCAVCVVLGVLLSVVVPVVMPLMALSGLRQQELERARTAAPFTAIPDDYRPGVVPDPISGDHSYALDLVHRDRGYRWWVAYRTRDGAVPTLTRRGARLRASIDRARVPTTAPVTSAGPTGPAGPTNATDPTDPARPAGPVDGATASPTSGPPASGARSG